MNEIYDMYPLERELLLPEGVELTGIFEGREV